MAAPGGQLRVSRYFAALALLIVALYALVFFTGPEGSLSEKLVPKLGLDLQGGTTVTLRASSADGKAPNPEELETARQILENRVNGTGVAEFEVVIEGDRNIVINVPGQDNEDVKRIGAPAQLRFREVLDQAEDIGDPAATPTPTPSTSGSASPSTTPSTTPSTSASPSATPSATPSASASPSASATPSVTPSTTGSASPAPAPSAQPGQAPLPKQEDVLKKLPAGLVEALDQIDPAQLTAPEVQAELKAVTDLTPAEVSVLPVNVQLKLPQITCAKLNARPAGSVVDPNQQAVACLEGSHTKLLLDKASVVGTDVSGASFNFDQTRGWKVDIKFTGDGQNKWTALTQKALNKQVAVVLDNTVVSAPNIESVIPGDAEITGSFTKDQANILASQLKYGALPLTFEQDTAQSITPTLGLEQLQAGLLAGGIGLVLVILYSLLYYRALGLVTIASLVVSAAIIFASIILLGRQIGFTLTLAGVAGFIVAVGITADSFVVYFERLKDEVKDGRSIRTAVPRAWVRARRTILSADTVSFLAAAVLYILAVGAVKGFAFTLGLSTIVDVVIVFLFTHPLVALLSRSKAFSSPRFTGLGNFKAGTASADTPPPASSRTGRVRPKES